MVSRSLMSQTTDKGEATMRERLSVRAERLFARARASSDQFFEDNDRAAFDLRQNAIWVAAESNQRLKGMVLRLLRDRPR